MLVHAVRTLSRARLVDIVVVAAPVDDVTDVRSLLADHEVGAEVQVVAGGAVRRQSVSLALGSLPADVDVVLVHDAARPLVPVELVDAVAVAVRNGAEAVVPALPVTDTVKQVDDGNLVTRTLDRSALRAVQTPQGFLRSVLEQAHAAAAALEQGGGEAGAGAAPAEIVTDDAGLVELLGRPVLVVPGAEEAFKVTRPLDLVLAEAVVARQRRSAAGVR
jgi:2-C-methyl-D-erythritol 4-phosphate cytidylyltransferase